MPPEPQLGSSIAAAVRTLLEGDFAPAGAVMDWLQEHRPEDLPHFRALVGHLAASTFTRGGELADRPVRPGDWDDFRHGVTALFWFELYTPETTWAALTGAYERMRTTRPGLFGFAGS
jgi:hypothetical protein